eukprot:20873-Heterococcus_DN1.PRE.3
MAPATTAAAPAASVPAAVVAACVLWGTKGEHYTTTLASSKWSLGQKAANQSVCKPVQCREIP